MEFKGKVVIDGASHLASPGGMLIGGRTEAKVDIIESTAWAIEAYQLHVIEVLVPFTYTKVWRFISTSSLFSFTFLSTYYLPHRVHWTSNFSPSSHGRHPWHAKVSLPPNTNIS
jgi:hypothetical protein